MPLAMDMTDVPAVTAEDLTFALETLINRGRGLAILNGISEDDLRAVETEIWRTFKGDAVRRLAVSARLRSVLEVFSSRRLKALFLETGLGLLKPAAEIAASQRLNGTWGFNPQKFLMALNETRKAAAAQPRMMSLFAEADLRLAA